MSRYYNNNPKSRRERIGFYTAFAICLIAVCMAVYSTYNTVSDSGSVKPASTAETGVAVNQVVTGVPATIPEPTLGTLFLTPSTVPTETAEPETLPVSTAEATAEQGREDALETMLAAEISLDMPTQSGHVLRQYSRDSVYFKTLNTWKPHTGVDFDGELGDKISAMLNGEVTRVYDDKLYGKTVEVSVNNVVVGYCGLGAVDVKQGDKLERGDKIGTIGAVPFEADDKPHVHVFVKVNGSYADPLNFISNNE